MAARRLFPVVLGLALLVALGAGAWWWLQGRFVESTDNAYVEADIAVIAPRVAGYIREVAVTDNQPVKRGDPLIVIEPAEYRAALARNDAEVERQRRAIGSAAATVAAGGAGIAEAEAALTAAQAQAARARADAGRAKELLDKGFSTRAVFDERQAAARAADAAVSQARAAIALARAQRTASAGAEGGAGASLRAALAQREAAALDLANTVIRAPVDGVVGNRSARVGQYARQGLQLMVVVPVQASYVVANFKETQIARMHPGMPVKLEVDAYPDAPVRGRIASLSPAAGSRFSLIPPENATGNFTRIVQRVPIRIELERPIPDGVRLVPGLSVTASVDLRER